MDVRRIGCLGSGCIECGKRFVILSLERINRPQPVMGFGEV